MKSIIMNYEEAIKTIESLHNPANIEGMARFGIRPTSRIFGVPVPELRKLAKQINKENSDRHELALKLWDSKIHEAKILAGFIDNPSEVTEAQMEKWVSGFDSWDVCDQVCGNLFDKTEFAYKKAFEWSKRKEEFVKRAGFAMMAALAVHDKKATDEELAEFFPVIKREAADGRNFVRKAVNWALRQIGKRNAALNKEAIKVANEIKGIDSKSARWVALNALSELTKKEF